MHVLILGGTTEARRLAELLAAGQPAGPRVTTSLAGRVSAPRTPPGEVRVGGFGGAEGLAAWLREHAVGLLVDATHPFAGTITRNAAHAAATAGVPLLVLRRPGWRPVEGDVWHEAGSLAEAAALLPALGRRVFLTTGRTGLAVFAPLADPWFLVRSVDAPEGPARPHGGPAGPRPLHPRRGARAAAPAPDRRPGHQGQRGSGHGAETDGRPRGGAARGRGAQAPGARGVRVVAEPGQAARWVAEARARRSPRRP